MPIELSGELGTISITHEVIANLAGAAAMECYGLVGMVSRNQLMDGIAELIRKENLSRGVEIRMERDAISVDLYIVVSYGVKISEVASNVQSRVKYILRENTGLEISEVNVFIQDVRVS
ncbi:Asp23/Gls24 family envelope stress response protein [Paenibacillus thalictri]|uniref:Asp23/Gls24 family envelope stress response protein n=1 Tax=Paenibacillus thalictri TaxID=2527873 RepID=A0A4Q9DPT4_9BACL|nr:Asp23/Gls24 family envelope stress response protein [Paenibacillus thalictri]TBL78343.1 Asp23/Gls24 family envelope stress response protein [Paenibacillus thalictri]